MSPPAGRPRKPLANLPAHIDAAKLPRGIYWDSERRCWYVREANKAGKTSRKRVADATVWPRLFGGCHTHRHTEDALRRAGFGLDRARRQWTLPRWLPLPVGEFALGRAVRP